jgi:hypothetical protein
LARIVPSNYTMKINIGLVLGRGEAGRKWPQIILAKTLLENQLTQMTFSLKLRLENQDNIVT